MHNGGGEKVTPEEALESDVADEIADLCDDDGGDGCFGDEDTGARGFGGFGGFGGYGGYGERGDDDLVDYRGEMEDPWGIDGMGPDGE